MYVGEHPVRGNGKADKEGVCRGKTWKNIMYMYETVMEARTWIWLSDRKCLVYTKPWVTGTATDEAGLKSPLLPKS